MEWSGGESGIRTHVRVSPKHAFQACAFSHSAISPASLPAAKRVSWEGPAEIDFMGMRKGPQLALAGLALEYIPMRLPSAEALG